jgi:hypothetical protein
MNTLYVLNPRNNRVATVKPKAAVVAVFRVQLYGGVDFFCLQLLDKEFEVIIIILSSHSAIIYFHYKKYPDSLRSSSLSFPTPTHKEPSHDSNMTKEQAIKLHHRRRTSSTVTTTRVSTIETAMRGALRGGPRCYRWQKWTTTI